MPKETKNEGLKQEFASFSTDVSKLRHDLTKIVRKLTEFGKDEVGEMRDNLISRGKRTLNSVESNCKRKPLASMGYAFGAGLLAGLVSRLMSRKHKK